MRRDRAPVGVERDALPVWHFWHRYRRCAEFCHAVRSLLACIGFGVGGQPPRRRRTLPRVPPGEAPVPPHAALPLVGRRPGRGFAHCLGVLGQVLVRHDAGWQARAARRQPVPVRQFEQQWVAVHILHPRLDDGLPGHPADFHLPHGRVA
ncbi:hypothetical protein B0H14DRAFT_2779413 [Mycena olivaceomarginata]|nr:hypothetical protein B0H14DRAFT_2779413 [Mycena olivaceomarginata]